jgi:hypothetical protein
MKPVKKMSLGELAAFVCTHLRKYGIQCVMTGGACVSIYTENRYQSYDIDFIENVSSKRKTIIDALEHIGFYEENKYFRHPETVFFIEFPSGPLAIGNEPVKEPHKMTYPTGLLWLLSPTDCVKDRLAAYYHCGDKQCLEQAVMIAEDQDIDIDEIKRWSAQENMIDKFESIKHKLTKIE